MSLKSELEAAKERRRAYRRAYHAKRFATEPRISRLGCKRWQSVVPVRAD